MGFVEDIKASYDTTLPCVALGAAMDQDGNVQKGLFVKLLAKNFVRHGLIAGATGTGKTKSLQLVIEQLSNLGVPILAMDIKGDLSGLAQPGVVNDKVSSRANQIGFSWQPEGYPVELLTLGKSQGLRLRASISEFGPMLLAKTFELNETQESILSVIFHFCDENGLALIDLKDLKSVLEYIMGDGKTLFEQKYGSISTSSINIIIRKIIQLQSQGGDDFFGEPAFDIKDLFRQNDTRGVVSILRLMDMQTQPLIFSSFMLGLLSQLYEDLPEVGDVDIPKLVVFIDEAHLIFEQASKSLLDKLETIIKLIRSKGVGIWFITQSPSDIPQSILGQLGSKIQHALRAFSAKDAKDIKLAAQNFPTSKYYQVDKLLTGLGTGEALVSGLNEKGLPTELVRVLMAPPSSRMDILTDAEVQSIVNNSSLAAHYNQDIDPQSAYEILSQKMQSAQTESTINPQSSTRVSKPQKSVIEEALNSSVGKTVLKEVTRGIFGMLKPKTTRRRSSSSGLGGIFGL